MEVDVKYQIKVEGQLNSHWNNWFDGMAIDHEGETTVLTGSVEDQSQLHGLLHRIRDLNLTLISVNRLESRRQGKTNREDRR